MSICLTLTGMLSAKDAKITLPALLSSFGISFVISMVIGLLIPVHKVNGALGRKLGLKPGKLSTRFFESFVSDLIYTPVMTLCMVLLAHKKATENGAKIPFAPMFLRSLLICFAVAYVLVFFLTPLFLKFLMKRAGIPANGRPDERPENAPDDDARS